ncbi:MAG: hypothetical protein JW804_06735 [Sedimentisphaerales bacterium]|nr:hypothetical protein [Sedimentisphaerales bacterium]
MYHQRVNIFIIIVAGILAVCVLRLGQMQLLPHPGIDHRIEELKLQQRRVLNTARGRILDRNGRVLAQDMPEFELLIDYRLSNAADVRVTKAKLLEAAQKEGPQEQIEKQKAQIDAQKETLDRVIKKLASLRGRSGLTDFGSDIEQTQSRIEQINNRIWNLREYLAWKRDYSDYNDFSIAVPDPNRRLLLTAQVDIVEMYQGYHLADLESADDVFAAQIEFADINEIIILPQNKRAYPYRDVACQVIGWVRPQHQTVLGTPSGGLFAEDPLMKYLDGELSGYRGTEYVCESILRGRRGREVYDIDKELMAKTETRVGDDVGLTIDIHLQQQIQQYITDCNTNPNCDANTVAVVIDVPSGDILAMVSMPVFDLNRIRVDFAEVAAAPNKPLYNRALQSHYPPGSVIKPLILIAGLESKKITPTEVISCPAEKAPEYWPSCWIYNQYRIGHDSWWTYNNARNAIRGSCNIYFSRLADRLDPAVLQRWLFKFGYGKSLEIAPDREGRPELDPDRRHREFSQVDGFISSSIPKTKIDDFRGILPLKKSDLRWFGIGQGNLRVTPLQVANAMAALARKGLYKKPNLFLDKDRSNRDTSDERRATNIYLGISPETIDVVYEGMRAVVYEDHGTANKEFKPMLDYFDSADVKIYGKTGSTQGIKTAWFGGFAKDSTGRAVSIAVVVEGGEHGSEDAAPLARDIIDFCIQFGYLGRAIEYVE